MQDETQSPSGQPSREAHKPRMNRLPCLLFPIADIQRMPHPKKPCQFLAPRYSCGVVFTALGYHFGELGSNLGSRIIFCSPGFRGISEVALALCPPQPGLSAPTPSPSSPVLRGAPIHGLLLIIDGRSPIHSLLVLGGRAPLHFFSCQRKKCTHSISGNLTG